jgi:hypothetical protein
MNPVILLRLASVAALIQGAAHTLLVVFGAPTHGPTELAVVEAMKAHHFNFLGSARSYWDFYFGYALFAAFNCAVEAVLFWQLARIGGEQAPLVKPVIALFVLANLGYAVLAWKYFFITPIVPDIAIAICLGLALVSSH